MVMILSDECYTQRSAGCWESQAKPETNQDCDSNRFSPGEDKIIVLLFIISLLSNYLMINLYIFQKHVRFIFTDVQKV